MNTENIVEGGESLRRPRPIGVWLLTVCHTVYAVAGIASWTDALWGSPADELSMIMGGRAPYMIGLFTILLLSAWGAWTGSRQARWLFVLILTTVIAASLKELFSVPALVEGRDQAAEQWWSAFRYSATIGTAMLVWWALVSWYFFSERTRYFFATRSTKRQDDGKGAVPPH